MPLIRIKRIISSLTNSVITSISSTSKVSVPPYSKTFTISIFLNYVIGKSWSGRLRYLANCNSVLIIPTLNYIAHFYPLLESDGPHQNYVHVEHDFSDLDDKMSHFLSHPKESERIAEESKKAFRDRYLTPAAEACYYRRMYRVWSELQKWEPKLWMDKKDEDGKWKKVRRGRSYEAWEMPNPFD